MKCSTKRHQDIFRLTVNDTDIWFKTREMQQTDLGKQMVQLQKDIKQMSKVWSYDEKVFEVTELLYLKEKMSLFVSTTTFRRNLVSLLRWKFELKKYHAMILSLIINAPISSRTSEKLSSFRRSFIFATVSAKTFVATQIAENQPRQIMKFLPSWQI